MCVYNFDLDAKLVANCQEGAIAMLLSDVVRLATALPLS